nr:hypothetical protein [uncultured Rhodoferax sp.]
MNARIGREKFLTIALTVAALLLAGVLLWEWNQAMRLQQELLKMRNIPAVAAKPLNVLPEFILPTEEAGFPELISRSLFSINRRSSAVATKGGVASMKKGQFALVGVLITPQRSSVQLRDVQTNRAETVALNGVVRGMTVTEVGPSKVVLRQGAESEELLLNVQTGPKTAAARVAAPVAAPAPVPVAPPPSPPARVASGVALPASAPGVPPPVATPQPADLKKQ